MAEGIIMIILTQIAPHTIYIIGAYFYHAGDIDKLTYFQSYLENLEISTEKIALAYKIIDEESHCIYYGEDWNKLHQSKWWQWACVRQLAYKQKQFLDEYKEDPTPIIQEKILKRKLY